MKVIVLASRGLLLVVETDEGSSLMVHNINAEGIDEPGNNMIFVSVHYIFTKAVLIDPS